MFEQLEKAMEIIDAASRPYSGNVPVQVYMPGGEGLVSIEEAMRRAMALILEYIENDPPPF